MGWANYSDIGRVYELSAVYDDALKKDETFTNYAVMVANRILQDLKIPCLATYGKWGARIEPAVNPHLTEQQIELIAENIKRQPSWDGLRLSTHVFTYGNYNEEIIEYQNQAEDRAKGTAAAAKQYVEDLMKPSTDNDNKTEGTP